MSNLCDLVFESHIMNTKIVLNLLKILKLYNENKNGENNGD